ncbi:hypothetical protein M422DRAFT_45822 [Sphaerobolus stellatus SS14]|nr:hypothetical protein M422DRAFT_45822 [Sphaerobolus stellatus SS14]
MLTFRRPSYTCQVLRFFVKHYNLSRIPNMDEGPDGDGGLLLVARVDAHLTRPFCYPLIVSHHGVFFDKARKFALNKYHFSIGGLNVAFLVILVDNTDVLIIRVFLQDHINVVIEDLRGKARCVPSPTPTSPWIGVSNASTEAASSDLMSTLIGRPFSNCDSVTLGSNFASASSSRSSESSEQVHRDVGDQQSAHRCMFCATLDHCGYSYLLLSFIPFLSFESTTDARQKNGTAKSSYSICDHRN